MDAIRTIARLRFLCRGCRIRTHGFTGSKWGGRSLRSWLAGCSAILNVAGSGSLCQSWLALLMGWFISLDVEFVEQLVDLIHRGR